MLLLLLLLLLLLQMRSEQLWMLRTVLWRTLMPVLLSKTSPELTTCIKVGFVWSGANASMKVSFRLTLRR
jgi:hypothetical protein